IMRVLWDEGEATVAQVHRRLDGDKHRALTTIATMLSKMEKKGVVGHRIEGRQFVYRPEVTQEEVARSMVADLTQRVFQGDVAALVSHLLTEQEIDRDDLGRLVELVRREKTEQGHHESR
ncbi:MAG: BlaI/MecI/CopY family transcriptional regulator, partial [Planctomycetota bacterium]|nr:BlaI/MecI/CopY family transcriptional regulator [Planctomycetota bacterium]